MAALTATGSSRGDALARTLLELHLSGGTAERGELTEKVGCSRSVMGFLLGELVDRQLVSIDSRPSAKRKRDGGRPSHRVAISDEAPVAIAAQLGSDDIHVATVALGGRILRSERQGLSAGRGVRQVVDDLCALIAAHATTASRVFGVGVAVPSPVRQADGYVYGALHLDWPGISLRELMLQRIAANELRLAIGNDANLAGLAESRHGAGRGARQMLYLMTAQVGLGGALVSEQQLFTGANGYAIEPGHLTVNPDGARCVCGSRGCLDVEADHRALARAAGQEDLPSGQLISEVDALFAAARDGDNAANEVLLRVGARLGAGLASLVNLTDPDCIVLGGTLGRLLGLQPTPIVESVAQRSFLDRAGAIPIRPGALKDAAVLGAAELAFQPLLADPRAALLATH